MAQLSDILLLGDARLYEHCSPVEVNEARELESVIQQMASLVTLFREKYGKGRAIAASQIGVMKRLVVLNIDRVVPLFNPSFEPNTSEMFEIWDDCMSFPKLLVKVKRFRSITLTFRDRDWNECQWLLEDDMAELMQHECDHLDGILATQRAIDHSSFKMLR